MNFFFNKKEEEITANTCILTLTGSCFNISHNDATEVRTFMTCCFKYL